MNRLPHILDNCLLELDRRRYGATKDVAMIVGGFAFATRPISAGSLERCFESIKRGGSPRDARVALLRTVFTSPKRWWQRRDPVQLIVNSGYEKFAYVLSRHLSAPGIVAAGDPCTPLGELGRFTAFASTSGTGAIPLADAIRLVITTYGLRWYSDRSRWNTYDGTPPATLVWIEAFGLIAAKKESDILQELSPEPSLAPVQLPALPFMPRNAPQKIRLN